MNRYSAVSGCLALALCLAPLSGCSSIKNEFIKLFAEDYEKPPEELAQAGEVLTPEFQGKDGKRDKIAVQLREVASGFEGITSIEFSPVSPTTMLVLEKQGTIRSVSLKDGERATLLDISERVITEVEQGLLGMAFHPDYPENPRVYLNYTTENKEGAEITRVSEWRFPPEAPDLRSERVILEVEQPYANHNAGDLAFGPDGYLYVGFGDGGLAGDPGDHGQNKNTLLGTMVRIGVSEEPPEPEVWAYGLRNPWRYSFAPDGRLIVADVGQNRWEEVSIVEKGGNYGWNIMEAYACYEPEEGCEREGLKLPILHYGRDDGISITGGYVYQGGVEALKSKYVFGDFGTGRIWAVSLPAGNEVPAPGLSLTALGKYPIRISTFGRDAAGEVYVGAFSAGKVYKLETPAP